MKKALYILTFFCLALSYMSCASDRVDSLRTVLQNSTDPLEKFNTYYELSRIVSAKNANSANAYFHEAEELSKKINTSVVHAKTIYLKAFITHNNNDVIVANDLLKAAIVELQKNNLKEETAEAYNALGMNALSLGDYIGAIENFEHSNVLSKELNDQVTVCNNYLYTGRSFEGMGNNTKALEFYQQSLSLAKNLKRNRLISQATLFIGALYSESINTKLGLEYLATAADMAEKQKDTSMLTNAYTYIANAYYYKKEYQKALDMYEKVKNFSQYGSKNTQAGTLGNMGNVYADMGEMDKAMELQQQAIKMFSELGDKQGLTICYSAIAIDYLNMKQYDKSLEYFNKSLPLATQMQSLEDLIEIHSNLARLYEEKKDFEKAYINYKLFKQYSDTVYNSTNTQKLTELELNYQFEGKEKEAKLLQELTNERFKRTVYAAVSGALILLVVIILVLRANRQRKKTNEQLTISNNAIRFQKEELETHKKEITDSINYAKRIQESILPPDNYWKSSLPDSFIFYRPKDIVSGDFYWLEQKNDSVCFAAVDCTGHGVPGALMSVVGFNLLTQAVNEMNLIVPSEVLKHLDQGVTKTLRQSGDGKGVKDGMDLSLCSLNLKTNELQYAGAYNSLYYVSKGIFYEIKSDKFPIGVNIDGKVDNYTNHTVQLQKGDCVFLFSDGYADQFGGPKGKKYKYNQLKELLHKNHALSAEAQMAALADAFDSWKGSLEQVDDVLVIGVII